MSEITITIPLSALPSDTPLNAKDLIKTLHNKENLEAELKDSRGLNTKMIRTLAQALQELQDILNKDHGSDFARVKALRTWSDDTENKINALKQSYICDIM